MNKAYDRLGEIFREERQRRGLTGEQLARLAGVAPGSVFNFEQGTVKRPSFNLVASLARVLEFSVDNLIFEDTSDNRHFMVRQQLATIRSATVRIAQLTETENKKGSDFRF